MSDVPMTDAARQEFLAGLGLNPAAPALVEDAPAKQFHAAGTARLMPTGLDPHAMPVADIVFDDRLLDGFPDLTGPGLKAASDHVFAQYRSPGKDRDRHSLLHRRITEFIGRVRRSRATGGYVQEQIKASKEQRDIAALLAAKGMTVTDLVALLQSQEEK
jgi:hypothetical protein